MLALACSSSPKPKAEPVEAEPGAPPSEPAPAPAKTAHPGSQLVGGGPRPSLGGPCPTPGSLNPDPCGKHGRVAIEVDPATVSIARGAECQLAPLAHPPPGVHQPSACLEGDVLYAANACVACRLVGAGWSAKANVTELTSAQALEVQKQLGLPATRALSGREEWRRALDAARRTP